MLQDTRHTCFQVEAGGGASEVIYIVDGQPWHRLTCVGDGAYGHDNLQRTQQIAANKCPTPTVIWREANVFR